MIAAKDARTLAREILEMSQEEFTAAFRHSTMKRAKLRGLKRNAAVVLGNIGTLEDVPVIQQAIDDPEPLVREHAAWALQDYGFDAVVAPSFGDIFRTNAGKIGMLAITLPEDEVGRLMESIDLDTGSEMTVDLERRVIVAPDGREVPFAFDEATRERILNGLDDIALTLEHEDAIAAYEATHSIA